MENKCGCSCGNYRIDLEPNQCFCIHIGESTRYSKAFDLQVRLISEGYPATIRKNKELYSVQIGEYNCLDEAAMMEHHLRKKGYNTMLSSQLDKRKN